MKARILHKSPTPAPLESEAGIVIAVNIPVARYSGATDDSKAYEGTIGVQLEICEHSVGDWVNGMAHTNGRESFWSTLKQEFHGVFHRMSPKHLHLYVTQFAEKHNLRDLDPPDQTECVVAEMASRRIKYAELTKLRGGATFAATQLPAEHKGLRVTPHKEHSKNV